MPELGTAVVLLAAGEGARYAASGGAGHKLLADFRGRTVVGWAIEHAMAADVGPVYVVTGAVEVPVPGGVQLIHNLRWSEGMAASLRAAIDATSAVGQDGAARLDAVVVGLGDQPLVEAKAWRRVATAAQTPITIATYAGVRGHPVRLAAEVWPLLPSTGDAAARSVIRSHPDLVQEVPCEGSAADIDTADDLSRWA